MKTKKDFAVPITASVIMALVLMLGYTVWTVITGSITEYRTRAIVDDMPADLPAVNVMLRGRQTEGILYFEATNIFSTDNNYMMQLDTTTGDVIMAKRFDAFGMKFERHNDDIMSYYEYTQRQWNAQANHIGYGGIRYHTGGVMRIMNNEYRVVQTIEDGIHVDSHDLAVLDDGSYIYFGTEERPLDRRDSTITCLLDCFVLGQTLERVYPDGTKRTIWNSLDHYTQSDFVMDDVFELNHNILYDVIHANSVNVAPDGNLIISIRHTNEVMAINPDGGLLWRTRDYTFSNDDGFSHQHDAHILSSGNLLLFDNGNGVRDYSRAIEYAIDHSEQTLTQVWTYTTGHFAPNRGAVQRLGNGNTLINFVDGGIVEVDTAGNVLMKLDMPSGYASYQARMVEQ